MLTTRQLFACLILFNSSAAFSSSLDSRDHFDSVILNEPVVNSDRLQDNGAIELVGKWESTVFGHQTLTTRPDGTATISMSLTPLAVPFYGRKVELDLKWTLKGDYLTQHIVGGTPARSVEKLIRKYGETHEYLLVEHDAEHLLVRDVTGGGDPVRWTAVLPVQ